MTDQVPTPTVSAATSAADSLPWWRRAFAKALPWISLVTSIVGAVDMNRSEGRAGLVAAGSAGSWVVFVLLTWSHKRKAQASAAQTGHFTRVLRFTSASASQSLVQLPLFFSAPFYVQASAWTPLQCLFAAPFACAVLVSLWDPWCSRVLFHPVLGPALLAFASFAGWNAALPMLGLPHQESAWLTAAAVGIAIPAVHIAAGEAGKRRMSAILVGASIPLLLATGGMRAVPAAPLRVMSAAIGTQIVDRTLLDPVATLARSPGEILCWSAVRAPHGLKDNLVHVWTRNGVELRRVQLDVQGGRRAGFRTWSRISIPRQDRGHYECAVETPLGQTLAKTRLIIGR